LQLEIHVQGQIVFSNKINISGTNLLFQFPIKNDAEVTGEMFIHLCARNPYFYYFY